MKAEVIDGLRFIWGNGQLRTLSFTSWVLSFLYAPVSLAMIVLSRDHFHASASAIGLIFSVSAVGGIVGASIAPNLKARFTFSQIIIGTIVIQCLVTLVVGLAVSTLMMTVGWAIAFMCDPIFSTASSSYRLSITPDNLQGRVQSVYRLGGFGAEPLGAAIGGLCLGMIGPRTEIVVVAICVGCLASALSIVQVRVSAWR